MMPFTPPKMVDVAMGVDHAGHVPIAAVPAIELERRGSGLPADQGIDDYHPGVTLDEAHHG